MRKRPAANVRSRVCKKPATAQSAPNTSESSRHVTSANVQSGAVPHYYDVALHDMDVSDIRIAIPSYDRPETLCEGTFRVLPPRFYENSTSATRGLLPTLSAIKPGARFRVTNTGLELPQSRMETISQCHAA